MNRLNEWLLTQLAFPVHYVDSTGIRQTLVSFVNGDASGEIRLGIQTALLLHAQIC